MAKIDIGKVGISFEGDYDDTKTYEKLSIVNDNGVLYLSKTEANKKELSDSDYWVRISSDVVERYFGSKDEDPDSKTDGTDLTDGDVYYNTDDKVLKRYDKNNDEWVILLYKETGEFFKDGGSLDLDSRILQFVGKSTDDSNNYTGSDREVIVDTDKHTLVVQDGNTEGGFTLAKTSDLDSKADLNGNEDEKFKIKDAEDDNEAVSKSQLDDAVKTTVEDDIIKEKDGSPFKKILMYDATNDKNVYLYVDDDEVKIEDA